MQRDPPHRLFRPTYIRQVAQTPDVAKQLAADLAASLDGDPAYERHGELETSPWGPGSG